MSEDNKKSVQDIFDDIDNKLLEADIMYGSKSEDNDAVDLNLSIGSIGSVVSKRGKKA